MKLFLDIIYVLIENLIYVMYLDLFGSMSIVEGLKR